MTSLKNPCGDGECKNIKTSKCKNIDMREYKSAILEQCKTLSIYDENDGLTVKSKLDNTLSLLLKLNSGNFVFGKNPKQFLVLLNNIENIIKTEHLEHEYYESLEKVRKKYDYVLEHADIKPPDMSSVKPWAIENLDIDVIQSINDKLDVSTLKEHQKRPAAYLLENDRLLVVHGTGTGKTLLAIFAAEIFIKNNTFDNVSSPYVIFTAPPGLIRNFQHNLTKLGITDENYQVLSYNGLINLQKSGQYDGSNTLLIIDEVHNLRNQKSITSTCIREAAYNSKKVLMLTATPFVNNFNDFVPIINMLYSGDVLSSHQDFGKSWQVDSIKFEENIEKLEEYLKNRIDYFPTNYDDENFPTIIEENHLIKMTDNYLQPYEKLLDGKEIDLADIYNILNPKASNGITTEQSFKILYEHPDAFYNGCRRLVNTLYKDPGTLTEFNFLLNVYISEKISAAVNIIKQQGDNKKTIIYTNWLKQGIDTIAKVLDCGGYSGKYVIYTGSLNIDDREEIVEKYNTIDDTSAQILIMSGAGSEGIDLKCTNTVIVIDPPWNKSSLEQIVGRAARFKSHSDEQCEDKTVKVYYMILTTPSDISDNTDVATNQVKLGDILLYDIIEKKEKTTVELKNLFKKISINNLVLAAEETTIFPALDTIDFKEDKVEIIPVNYLKMFQDYIIQSDVEQLNIITRQQLRECIAEKYDLDEKLTKGLEQFYKDNKTEILECVKQKIYPSG